jgi:hypothetical protein
MAKTFTLDSLIGTGVVINGAVYRLLNSQQTPLLKAKEVDQHWKRYGQLALQDSLTDEEKTEFEQLPDRVCRLVLRAPDDVHKVLDDDQRVALIAAFVNPPTSRPTEQDETPAATT